MELLRNARDDVDVLLVSTVFVRLCEDVVVVARDVVVEGKLRAQSEKWTLAPDVARPSAFSQ